jgi:hypothetical protein
MRAYVLFMVMGGLSLNSYGMKQDLTLRTHELRSGYVIKEFSAGGKYFIEHDTKKNKDRLGSSGLENSISIASQRIKFAWDDWALFFSEDSTLTLRNLLTKEFKTMILEEVSHAVCDANNKVVAMANGENVVVWDTILNKVRTLKHEKTALLEELRLNPLKQKLIVLLREPKKPMSDFCVISYTPQKKEYQLALKSYGLSHDGAFLAVSEGDKILMMYNFDDGSIIGSVKISEDPVEIQEIVFSPDDQFFVVNFTDLERCPIIVNSKTFLVNTIRQKNVVKIAWADHGNKLILHIANPKSYYLIFDRVTGVGMSLVSRSDDLLCDPVVSPDTLRVAFYAMAGNKIQVVNVRTEASEQFDVGKNSHIRDVRFISDQKLVAIIDRNNNSLLF